MALPKLNEIPKYKVTVPSTGKKVTFRPYLVKEEKILLMALETQDGQAALNAIMDTLDACIQDQIHLEKLTTFDVEYLFTQIRAKSAGEKVTIGVKCDPCGAFTPVDIKIDEIKIDVPKIQKNVKLNDKVSIEMKWPSYRDVTTFENKDDNNVNVMFEMACCCIEAIIYEDERTLSEDCTKEEIMEFVESMTAEQFRNISNFIGQMPRMEHMLEFKCDKCGEKNNKSLTGLQDFLS